MSAIDLGTTTTNTPRARSGYRPVALWLLVCALLIFAMVVLGGVTRLTRSGLSIVEWQPIMGAIPPLTETHWNEAFDKYKRTPEYIQVNSGMSLAQFQRIFYIEWAHRLLGRLIGVVFVIPFLYFLARGRIDRTLALKLTALFTLGGLQGALGWYMVASGLVDVPRVSPYRLTAHLGLAVLIYGYTLWIAFGLLAANTGAVPGARGRRWGWTTIAAVFVMILTGGFVAGTHAGFVYNTFPLMDGRFIPPGLLALQPWWTNLFENVATVQFDHRLMAYVLAAVVGSVWIGVRRAAPVARVRVAVDVLLAALALQIMLGIATLVYVVPLVLAAAHQAGALLVFTAALYFAHAAGAARVSPSS